MDYVDVKLPTEGTRHYLRLRPRTARDTQVTTLEECVAEISATVSTARTDGRQQTPAPSTENILGGMFDTVTRN